jgi:hypothetical protein
LGDTLYWNNSEEISTGDMTKECRVANVKDIPDNTIITGIHNETSETIELTIVDDKIWAVENVPTNNNAI